MIWLRSIVFSAVLSTPRVIGGVLVTAALLKGSAFALGSILARTDPPWGGPWGQIILSEVEFVLGIALIVAPKNFWLRIAVMLLFIAFIVALGMMLSRGASSCGCGGWVRINPRYALGFDAAAIAMLILCHRVEKDVGGTG